MKISKLYKLLCFVLIVALAANIALVPISTAHAQGPVQNQQISLNKITDSIKVNEKAEYASTDNEKYTELTDKRTEYLKYYQLESKRYEAVSFGLPVHYLEDGKYQDIDNSLHLVTEKDGKQKYTNKANSFKAELTPVIDGDWIGSIIKDKYKVSWTIEGIKTGKSDGSSSIEQCTLSL